MKKKFYPERSRGAFTLIELLVVIAIIGILAGIILVALNAARGKAKDTRVRAELAQIRTAIETYSLTNGSYASLLCSPDSARGKCEDFSTSSDPDKANIGKLAKDIKSLIGTATKAYDNEVVIAAAANAYQVFAAKPSTVSSTTKYVCVDSTGKIGETTSATGSSIVTSAYLTFSANTDLVNLATVAELNTTTTNPEALCAWVYPTSTSATLNMKIIDNGKTILYRTANTNFLAFTSDGATILATSGTDVVPLNQWDFVCASRSNTGTSANLYINGVSKASGSSGTVATGTTNATIGNVSAGSQQFIGKISDVAFYNSATQLLATDIANLYSRTSTTIPTPTHEWTFNDGSSVATTTADTGSTGGNIGTLSSNGIWTYNLTTSCPADTI